MLPRESSPINSSSVPGAPTDRRDLLLYGKQMVHPTGYISGQMELTSRCEQRCSSCQSWIDHQSGAERGEWDLEDAKEFFRYLGKIPTFEHLTLTGGDPQSWPHLQELLYWFLGQCFTYKLRINTALPLELAIDDPLLWGHAFSEVRLSLDGVSQEYYRKMRGVDTDPEEILTRAHELKHSKISTLTCVSQRNIDHIPAIVERLKEFRQEQRGFRRAIFIPIRDMNDRALVQLELRPMSYQEKWQRLQEEFLYLDWTSFGEQVPEGSLSKRPEVDCWVSRISFHVKHDGALYTCCLMGGEALQTRKEFCFGNVIEDKIDVLWEKKVKNGYPKSVYADPESPCSKICLWKQSTMNFIAEEAAATTLTMP